MRLQVILGCHDHRVSDFDPPWLRIAVRHIGNGSRASSSDFAGVRSPRYASVGVLSPDVHVHSAAAIICKKRLACQSP
jgi:hypothetical protein